MQVVEIREVTEGSKVMSWMLVGSSQTGEAPGAEVGMGWMSS